MLIESASVIPMRRSAVKRPLHLVDFVCRAPKAHSVFLVGDFNEWTPGKHVLAKRTNGTRSCVVTLPAGSSYRFRYLGENGHWFDDDEAPRDGDAGRIDT